LLLEFEGDAANKVVVFEVRSVRIC
jgi:hypothetical protein